MNLNLKFDSIRSLFLKVYSFFEIYEKFIQTYLRNFRFKKIPRSLAEFNNEIFVTESLILAQNERWRRA